MKLKLTAVIFALLALIAALTALAFFGVLPKSATEPLLPASPVCAVWAADWSPADPAALTNPPAALPAGQTKEEADAALTRTVAAAKKAGANAILFLAHPGNTVYYASKSFPPLFAGYDPLAALCEKAGAENIAVFVVYAADMAGAADTAWPAKSPAATLPLTTTDAAARFDLADHQTLKLLKKDVAELVRNYPIAGVVFSAAKDADSDSLAALAKTVHTAQKETLAGLYAAQPGLFSSDLVSGLTAENFDFVMPLLTEHQLCFADGAAAAGTTGVFCDLSALPAPAYAALTGGASLWYGGVIGSSTDDALLLSVRASSLAGPIETESLAVSDQLGIGWPADAATTTADHVLLMGASDPAVALTVNGAPVTRSAKGGSWAYWAELSMGDNVFAVTQGSETVTRTVTRTEQVTTPSVTLPTPDTSLDTTLAGRKIRITSQLASALSNPASDSAISETLHAGAVAKITGTVETLRSGKIVTGYRLSSGDTVLSGSAELLGEADAPADALLAFGTCVPPENRRMALTLTGGAPAAYGERSGQSVTLRFLNTSFATGAADALAGCEGIASATVSQEEDAAVLTLTFADSFPLWGYDVSYDGETTLLRFSAAPTLSDLPGKPLTGVRILLDAGHGGSDTGAAGITGLLGGVTEKDANLAAALAVRERLVQLGADVTMTRTDDSFPSLNDRWAQGSAELPDFFLALHHNSTEYVKDTNTVAGMECYYHGDENAAFAAALLDAGVSATGRARVKTEDSYFYVCRQTAFRSALFEFGYLVNPAEMEQCLSADGLRADAAGIAQGVLDYLTQTAPAQPQTAG